MKISGRIFAIIFSLIFLGCDSSDSDPGGVTTPDLEKPFSNTADGWIGGIKWGFLSGKAVIDIHAAGDYLVIYLWNSDIADPCKETKGSSYQIHIKTLAREGFSQITKDPFKLDPVILFKAPKFTLENASADVGFVFIDRFTQDEVIGRFSGSFTNPIFSQTEATGLFRVPFCDEN